MNILIIGASSGIGKALFEIYAKEGNRLGIVGRRSHLLDELRRQHPSGTCRFPSINGYEIGTRFMNGVSHEYFRLNRLKMHYIYTFLGSR